MLNVNVPIYRYSAVMHYIILLTDQIYDELMKYMIIIGINTVY